MANEYWTGSPNHAPGDLVGGDWNTNTYWNNKLVPGKNDLAELGASDSAYYVTSTGNVTIGSLVIDPTIKASAAAGLYITGGTFTINGASSNAGKVQVGAGPTPAILNLLGAFVNNTSANGPGSLTVKARGTIDLIGGSISSNSSSPLNIDFGGVLEATGGTAAPSSISNSTIANKGTLLATNGTILTLTATSIKGGTLTATNGSAFTAVAGKGNNVLSAVTLTAGSKFNVASGSNLTLNGKITDNGTIGLGSTGAATDLHIGGTVTLSGNGQITLSDVAGGANAIVDDGKARKLIDNGVSIVGAGAIGNDDGKLTFTLSTGTINANGKNALTVNTGNIFTSAGILEASNTGGLVIDDALNDSGVLVANGGILTMNGTDTGTGKAEIFSNSSIDFAATSTSSVSFENNAGDTGLLVLGASNSFAGTVAGLANDGTHSDAIDLQGINFATASWSYKQNTVSQGELTVTDTSGHLAQVALLGQYLAAGMTQNSGAPGAIFQTASDGNANLHGTLLTVAAHH